MIKKIISTLLAAAAALSITVAYAQDNVEIYINKNSVGYLEEQGIFQNDVQNVDANGKTTRYSYSRNAKLSFLPQIQQSGNYRVYYWSTGHVTNRSQQDFQILSDDGEAKVTLDLTQTAGWKYLGVYKFSKGSAAKISMTRELLGGPVRSGMLRLILTDQPTAVAASQPKPGVKRYYLPGNGIFVNQSFKSDSYTYEEANGSFGTIAITAADGRTVHYTSAADGIIRYRPNIPADGKYHVLYFSVQNGSAATNTALKTTIYHAKGTTTGTLDCIAHNGWVYLGAYEFKQGTEGCLETQNGGAGKQLLSGGAYFVSVDDPDFDVSIYATPDNPGTKDGVSAGENGEYLITSDTVGYSETGLKSRFQTSGFYLDCNDHYTRYVSGAGSETCAMKYTADIEKAGTYEVLYFVTGEDSGSKAQRITVESKKGSTELTLDTTAQQGWVSLGSYQYDANSKAVVTAYSMAGAGGITYSGGVRIVKK